MASLDMSLDDMIKSRRNSDRGGGQGRPRRGRGGSASFRGGGRASGPSRRRPLGVKTQPSAFSIAKSIRRTKTLPWQKSMLEDSFRAAGMSGLENGTKLYVTNLAIGVTNEDIRELFTEIGELIRYGIHYGKNGRPSGSAEVVFARRSDAFKAHRKYNNVQLDGKPMKIEIDEVKSEVPVLARVNVVGGANGRRTVVMAPGTGAGAGVGPTRMRNFGVVNRGGFSQQSRGGGVKNVRGGGSGGGRGRGRGGRGGFGRGRGGGVGGGGRGGGGKKGVEKSAEQLDKELETYHSEAMQS